MELQQKLTELDEVEQQQQVFPVSQSGLTTFNSNQKPPRPNPFNNKNDIDQKTKKMVAATNSANIWPQIHANFGKKIIEDRLAWCQKQSCNETALFRD